ncbi:MAG: hypothetical protein J1F39_03950 [Clostridiales bacterium]|nr:hypothetical protein [Clostridiales bacterium]
MKKKLLSIISIFVAMLMCFALVACNEEVEPTPTPEDKNALPADKTMEAIDALLTAHGYKVNVKITRDSKSAKNPVTAENVLEKKGDVLKVPGDGETVYYNFATGYSYYEEDGEVYYYSQFLPSGYAAYLKDVVYGMLPETPAEKLEFYNKLQEQVKYDPSTKTGTYNLALKEVVNLFADPAQSAYKDGKTSVLKLIDTYLAMFVADSRYKTLDGVLTALINNYDAVKDATLGELLDEINDTLGVSVKDILESSGMGLPEEAWEIIDARTVGETLTALTNYMEAKLFGESDPEEDEEGPAGGIDPDDLFEAINTALFSPVNPDDVAATPAKLRIMKGVLIGVLDSIPFKTAVDTYGDELPPDLAILIKNNVKFTKLDAEIKFTFDDDYNFSKITLDAGVAHNYTSVDGDDAEFFADNDYSINAVLDFSDYTTEGEFTLTAPEREDNPEHVEVSVIVRADSKDATYDFYYEEGSDITVSGYTFYNVQGEPYSGMDNAVTYNAETKTFSVKASALSPVISAENFYTEQSGTVFMTALVSYGEGETYVLNVYFFVAKDATLDSAVNVSVPVFSKLFGGSDGDYEEYPDFDYQPAE